MSQTGTRIIQILATVAFLLLALSLWVSWTNHKEIRDFHEKKFAQLQSELQVGMTKDQVRSKLTEGGFKDFTETTESRWSVRWFEGKGKDATQLQTERLGVPTWAELIFDEDGKLSKINGLE